jgi:hypothetical protein
MCRVASSNDIFFDARTFRGASLPPRASALGVPASPSSPAHQWRPSPRSVHQWSDSDDATCRGHVQPIGVRLDRFLFWIWICFIFVIFPMLFNDWGNQKKSGPCYFGSGDRLLHRQLDLACRKETDLGLFMDFVSWAFFVSIQNFTGCSIGFTLTMNKHAWTLQSMFKYWVDMWIG